MKRFIIFFLFFYLLNLLYSICNAQVSAWRYTRQELIIGAGATNFLGELGGSNQIGTNGLKDFDWPSLRSNLLIGYRYRITRETAIKTYLLYGILSGNDKYTDEIFRKNRNCNFRTPIIELSTQFEYAIIRERPQHIYNLKGIRGWRYLQVATYIFGGAGVMYFNPKGEWNGKWYHLKPLCTEGEGLVPTRNEYSLFQVVFPFGVGFKYALNRYFSIGIECSVHKTFTDYIDDVSKTYFDPNTLKEKKGDLAVHFANPTNQSIPSWEVSTSAGQQRGDPSDKDSFMFAVISVYYKIKKGRFTVPKFR